MKKLAIVCGLAVSMMAFSAARAEDAKAEKSVSGVLIDQSCADKQMGKKNPEKAAEKHEKSCVQKCGEKAGYAVIEGKKEIKLDSASNDKVKDYLAKDDSTTKVTIKGTENADGTLSVASIEKQ